MSKSKFLNIREYSAFEAFIRTKQIERISISKGRNKVGVGALGVFINFVKAAKNHYFITVYSIANIIFICNFPRNIEKF